MNNSIYKYSDSFLNNAKHIIKNNYLYYVIPKDTIIIHYSKSYPIKNYPIKKDQKIINPVVPKNYTWFTGSDEWKQFGFPFYFKLIKDLEVLVIDDTRNIINLLNHTKITPEIKKILIEMTGYGINKLNSNDIFKCSYINKPKTVIRRCFGIHKHLPILKWLNSIGFNGYGSYDHFYRTLNPKLLKLDIFPEELGICTSSKFIKPIPIQLHKLKPMQQKILLKVVTSNKQ